MADKSKNPPGNGEEEEGLDELLDSALEDFDKIDKKTTEKEGGPAKTEATTESSSTVPALEDLDWNEDFIRNQAKLFEDKMAALFGAANGGEALSPEVIQQGFQRMTEAASMAMNPNTQNVADPNFSQSITEALRGLSEGAESLQAPFSADDVAEMFGNVNLADTTGENPFLPFMQGMMQSLLSAEILLPSLQDLVSKYPEWLTKNAATVAPEDKERYEKQMELMKKVMADLETERPDDSAEVKQARFEKVFANMQRMQEFGQPPPDLVEVDPAALPPGFVPPHLMGNQGDGGPQCPTM